MRSARDVLDHHLQAFGDGDLDGVMADYTDDSVLFTPDGPLKGPEAIRGLYIALLEEFGKPGMSVEMLQQDVEGECAYIVWKASVPISSGRRRPPTTSTSSPPTRSL